MTHGAGSTLINIRNPGRLTPAEEAQLRALARDRPRSGFQGSEFRGAAARAGTVRPRWSSPSTNCRGLSISAHDTAGDAQGRVWYSTHRSSYVGRLNPANGHVEEFHVPLPQAGALPGTHWIYVDKQGHDAGARRTGRTTSGRLDPISKDFKRIPWKVQEPINSPMRRQCGFDPEGISVAYARRRAVSRIGALDGRKRRAIRPRNSPRPMAAP